MAVEQDLFRQTFEIMNTGDCLMIAGGTFPGEGVQTDVTIDLKSIIPIIDIVRGSGDKPTKNTSALYDNPLNPDEPWVELELLRKEGRFRFDTEDSWLRIGRGLGVIADHEVDLVLVGQLTPDFYLLAKP